MKQVSKERVVSTRFLIITGVIAALFLVIANSGLWVNRYVFNETAFSEVAVGAITSESSRNAIATGVANNIYQGRPLVGRVLAEPTTDIVEGLLGSRQAERALTATATRLNIVLTSKEQENITLDLTGVKSALTKLAGVTNDRSTERLDPDRIPENIVILDSSKLPNLYGYATAMLIISPLALIAAVVLLAWPYIKKRADWERIIRVQGAILIAAGLLAELLGPIFRPITLSVATEPAQRTVLANLYDAFIVTFNMQTLGLIALGLIMVLSPLLYRSIRKVIVSYKK